ncbi:formate--tetrahydrofolate ligase [Bartonella quintana]|nr:formate--tetrahydrofolate ligase [Bartonella quintana]
MQPNLVQTIENNPVLVHRGLFQHRSWLVIQLSQ